MIDMETLIHHIGLPLSWLNLSDPKFQEKSLLYQSFRVCDSWSILYKSLTELKSVSLSIAQAFDPSVPSDQIILQNRYPGVSHTHPNMVNCMNKSTKNRQLCEDWVNPMQYRGDIHLIDDMPIKRGTNKVMTHLHRFRFLVWVYQLEEVKLAQGLTGKEEFYLRYTVLGKTVRYKISLEHWQEGVEFVPVSRINMFYFFATQEEGHRLFYAMNSPLRIGFLWGDDEIGNIELVLKEVGVGVIFRDVIGNCIMWWWCLRRWSDFLEGWWDLKCLNPQ